MGTVPIVTWAVSVAGGAIPAFFVVPVRIAGKTDMYFCAGKTVLAGIVLNVTVTGPGKIEMFWFWF